MCRVFRNKARLVYVENKGYVRSSSNTFFKTLYVKCRKPGHVMKSGLVNVSIRFNKKKKKKKSDLRKEFVCFFPFCNWTRLCIRASLAPWFSCWWCRVCWVVLAWVWVFPHLWGFLNSQPSSGLKRSLSSATMKAWQAVKTLCPLRLPYWPFPLYHSP